MTNEEIQRIALAHGFKLKEQPDGSMALNPYVFEFANSLLIEENLQLKAENERLREDAERLTWLEAHLRPGEIHVNGEVKDCYLYAVSGAPGVPLRAIIDALMKETK